MTQTPQKNTWDLLQRQMMALRLEVPGVIVDEIENTIDKLLQETFAAGKERGERKTIPGFGQDKQMVIFLDRFKTYQDYLNHINKQKANESSAGKTQIDPGP